MLLSLPPQLIQRILLLSLSPTITRATYGKRQRFLAQLCLVSKSFLRIARPLLEASLKVVRWSLKEGDGNRTLEMQRRGDLKVVFFEYVRPDKAFHDCKALRTVSLYKVKDHNLRWVELLPQLTTLTLFECVVVATPKAFPTVVEFTCEAYFINPSEIRDSFLTPETFPSLRYLAFSAETSKLGPKPQRSLLSQLLTLSVIEDDVDKGRLSGIDINGYNPPVLVDVPLNGQDSGQTLLKVRASHVRLFNEHTSSTAQATEAFRSLSKAISRDLEEDKQLETVLLPEYYVPARVQSESLRTAVEKLVTVCEKRGIEVGFDDRDESPGASLVSYWFKRWAMERQMVRDSEERVAMVE